ncbi:helix-turn-helix domain-containing protein (plasmid) [Furfurilactobacillus rossiae]|uniref:helix-turn-helix domain-containing protein n=1 Tax=Furfurilactobacillus rossiae TaxID=231049 RepID=UPI001F41AD63|nr:helix-turn-helix transcriptional regulator [Furfurilactobacillus rossiae]MCF6164808.1 helix-turn-helix domain-containing protein [Furfurilactobacillus rossiae]
MDKKDLAARIVDLREQKNMKQSELAKLLKLDKSSMSKLESGSRNVSTEELQQLSKIFNVTTDYLLGNHQTPVWANQKDSNDLAAFLTQNEGSMTYEGDNLTDDEKAQLRVAMETIFWKRHRHGRTSD